MLIATITALAILFGGGTFETFFIDDLRKGVKEYVVEDERKDEILDDLKRSKKMIKSFNKERKAQFKEFKKLNSSQATGSDELTGFFLSLIHISEPTRPTRASRMPSSA